MSLNDIQVKQGDFLRQVIFPDGTSVPAIGQGTWFMGENPNKAKQEIDALRLGIELGMTVIDTAEMYGSGGAERIVGKALENIRDQAFLVSKVLPYNADKKKMMQACEASLKRLNTDYLDLYLLHWRGSVPLTETVEAMEMLVTQGKIKRWGVSNFDTVDMQEVWEIAKGNHCMVNQVLYHLGSRGIEYDLLPWCKEHYIPIMAYCPIAQGGSLRQGLMNHPSVLNLAETNHCTPAQLLLAWCIRHGNVVAIPKASSTEHVIQNAQAATLKLTLEELTVLDNAFKPPFKKMHLDIV